MDSEQFIQIMESDTSGATEIEIPEESGSIIPKKE
jgi:hypothetical protein